MKKMNEEIMKKEKELIENTIHSLLEEWEMYSNSISQKNLEYIKDVSKSICHFKKKLEKMDDDYEEHKSGKFDMVEDSNVDNAMFDAINEYASYMDYKKKYMETKSEEYVTMSEQEFEHMLDNLKIALTDINDLTKKDNSAQSMKERDMLKGFAKWAYQMFS